LCGRLGRTELSLREYFLTDTRNVGGEFGIVVQTILLDDFSICLLADLLFLAPGKTHHLALATDRVDVCCASGAE
jgi:hypothetical protein